MQQKHRKRIGAGRRLWISLLLAGTLLIGAVGCAQDGAAAQDGPRQASPEEVAFFEGQVLRNVSGLSEEELRTAVYSYMNEVNAFYWLGSELDLCEPFNFEQLQKDWEADNAERESKRKGGEVVYGPDSLSLDAFFPYQYSALQSDIVRKILDERSDELVADARKFYDQNPEIFTRITSITYEAEGEGETVQKTIRAEEFRFYGQSDPQLMDFLAAAEDGEETVLDIGMSQYTVKRIGTTTELVDFDEDERTVVEMFLYQEQLDQWLEQIARTHEVVF